MFKKNYHLKKLETISIIKWLWENLIMFRDYDNLSKIKEERRVQHWGDDNSGKHIPHPSQICSPPQEHSTRPSRHYCSLTKFFMWNRNLHLWSQQNFITALSSHSKKQEKTVRARVNLRTSQYP